MSSCFSASIGGRSRTHALPSPRAALAGSEYPADPASALARARMARPSSAERVACSTNRAISDPLKPGEERKI